MARGKKKTTEEFVADARKVHGDLYNYDKTVYTGSFKKVIIKCAVHGDFEQIPCNHLSGYGCAKCRSDVQRSDTETFIKRAVEIHGDKYKYDAVVYRSTMGKVTITCPKHGNFEQMAVSHLSGHGCVKCRSVLLSSDRETFIKRAVEIHGDKYKYDSVVYKGSNDKVIITCPNHGNFEQKVRSHLSGNGCPKCADTWSGDGVVYVMCSPEGYNKIGVAKCGKEYTRLNRILKSQQTKSPTAITGLSLVCAYRFTDGSFTEARKFEGKAHRHFKARRKVFTGKFDGSCEFFTVPVSEICSYLEQQGGKLVTIKR